MSRNKILIGLPFYSFYTPTHTQNHFCTVKSQTYGTVKRNVFSNHTWVHEHELLEDCWGSWLQAITEYILLLLSAIHQTEKLLFTEYNMLATCTIQKPFSHLW
jgi:hypothetical protein